MATTSRFSRRVKRRGKVVYGSFFREEGLNPEFPLACDRFFAIDEIFEAKWKASGSGGDDDSGTAQAEGPGGEPNAGR